MLESSVDFWNLKYLPIHGMTRFLLNMRRDGHGFVMVIEFRLNGFMKKEYLAFWSINSWLEYRKTYLT